MNRKQKNLMIGGLLGIVLILGVAYAAFQTQLNINGTSTIDSKWDIKMLSITPDKTATNSGTAQNPNYTTAGDINHSITNNDLTANFQTALVSPGDSVVYTVVVKNNGTLNAALKTITKTDSSNPAITFTVEGITENDVIGANDTKTFTVTVAYANVTDQPAATTSNLSLTLDFTQTNSSSAGGGSELSNIYYVYDTAGHRVGDTLDTTGLTPNSYPSGSNVALKYVLNGSNQIEEIYTCHTFGIFTDPICVRADTDGTYFEDNKAILTSLLTNSEFTRAGGSCTGLEGGPDVTCSISGSDIYVGDTGYVAASFDEYPSDYLDCVFQGNGRAFCN